MFEIFLECRIGPVCVKFNVGADRNATYAAKLQPAVAFPRRATCYTACSGSAGATTLCTRIPYVNAPKANKAA